MGAGHGHPELRGRRLGVSVLLNMLITAAQLLGGVLTGSLALISDALHNLTDVLALSMSWVATRLRRKRCTPQKTFGYKRAELMAALVNGLVLFAVSLFLIVEAYQRLADPQVIDGALLLILGGAAVGVNGFCAWLLHADSRENLNMKSAYLHLLTDMATSLTVMAGGAAMIVWQAYWVDSVITIAISLALMYFSGKLILDAVRIFMQFAPPDLDLFSMEDEVASMDGIDGLHHIHVWQLSECEVHMEAHVSLTEDLPVSEADRLLTEVERHLIQEHGINHVTLRPEHRPSCPPDLVIQDPDEEHNHLEDEEA